MATASLPNQIEETLRILEKSHAAQSRRRHLEAVLGPTEGLACLLLGGDLALHVRFRQRGGSWESAVRTPAEADAVRRATGGGVHCLQGPPLPFRDGQFDRVLVVDFLEYVADDYAFVAECHRVLRPEGRLILHVTQAQRALGLAALRRLLGVVEPPGRVRCGYTSSALFEVLKDGFDVEVAQAYGRFFAEAADLLVELVAAYRWPEPPEGSPPAAHGAKKYKFYAATYRLCQAAEALDRLLIFSRGHHQVARARRRIWKPRRTPVLADGRSIAEAALGGKIGTAAPF